MKTTPQQKRCMGLLLGLCKGDLNGGPQRLAMRIAESLAETMKNDGSDRTFDQDSVVQKYLNWYSPTPFNPEPENCFDTGVVFLKVFSKLHQRLEATSSTVKQRCDRNFSFPSKYVMDEITAEIFQEWPSAGIGPAHRNAVLAMAHFLNEDELVAAAKSETTITHRHEESIDTSVAVSLICRHLIENGSDHLDRAVQYAIPFVTNNAVKKVLQSFPSDELPNNRGGKSAVVLQNALYFLNRAETFQDALSNSIIFAGEDNYCPVLVGSIGGAMFGIDGVMLGPQPDLSRMNEYRKTHLKRIQDVAKALASDWS